MNDSKKYMPLHGWDDEKVYFSDEITNQEWCVTDETELYERLTKICREYFKKKSMKREEQG